MAASSAMLRMLLVLCALATPALAVVGPCKPRGPVKSCEGDPCCPTLKCGFSSTGGGFYCL